MRTTVFIPAGAAFVVAGLLALSSCATLNEEQCATADWAELGRSDGAAGRPAGYVERHEEACSKHGLPVNRSDWRVGWESGIREYCTPRNGLIEGREGRHYADSCPPELKADFENAYYVGKRLHEARRERDRVQAELDRLLDDLVAAENAEERSIVETKLSLKRDDLFRADSRVRDAERAYDLFVISNDLARS